MALWGTLRWWPHKEPQRLPIHTSQLARFSRFPFWLFIDWLVSFDVCWSVQRPGDFWGPIKPPKPEVSLLPATNRGCQSPFFDSGVWRPTWSATKSSSAWRLMWGLGAFKLKKVETWIKKTWSADPPTTPPLGRLKKKRKRVLLDPLWFFWSSFAFSCLMSTSSKKQNLLGLRKEPPLSRHFSQST